MPLSFISSQESRELILTALEWLHIGSSVALVTLINVDGNSPYPVGSQMLVNERAEYLGQITGGCAEQAIAEHAASAIKLNRNVLHRYGAGSPYFDIQLPCGSGVDVLIDTCTDVSDYESLSHALMNREVCHSTLVAGAVRYVKTYYPKQRLILFGQGPILLHTAKIGLACGFDVVCIAQNTHTQQALRCADLSSILLSQANDFIDFCDEFTGVISLFHEHDHETEVLARALTSRAFYVGALGSRKTHALRLSRLGDMGCTPEQLQRIHGPVGVNILATTPAQIALSIITEAVDRFNASLQRV